MVIDGIELPTQGFSVHVIMYQYGLEWSKIGVLAAFFIILIHQKAGKTTKCFTYVLPETLNSIYIE